MKQDEQSENTPKSSDESASPDVPEVAPVDAELEEALREKDQFRTMAQRAQADLTNYKRRAVEEQQEAVSSTRSHLLIRFFSIIDDIDRALTMIPEDAVAPGWLEGLRLVERNIAQLLESEGVVKIEPLGKQFEPFECEAVFYDETTGDEDGRVTSIVRNGYRHRDRVLRAAQVVVAKRREPKAEEKVEEDPNG